MARLPRPPKRLPRARSSWLTAFTTTTKTNYKKLISKTVTSIPTTTVTTTAAVVVVDKPRIAAMIRCSNRN